MASANEKRPKRFQPLIENPPSTESTGDFHHFPPTVLSHPVGKSIKNDFFLQSSKLWRKNRELFLVDFFYEQALHRQIAPVTWQELITPGGATSLVQAF